MYSKNVKHELIPSSFRYFFYLKNDQRLLFTFLYINFQLAWLAAKKTYQYYSCDFWTFSVKLLRSFLCGVDGQMWLHEQVCTATGDFETANIFATVSKSSLIILRYRVVALPCTDIVSTRRQCYVNQYRRGHSLFIISRFLLKY